MKLQIKIIALLGLLVMSSPLFAASKIAPEKLRIYAASSMTNALNSLISDYREAHDVSIVPIYGGSSSLARQIEQGAPADIFISANTLWVDRLIQTGVVTPADVADFASNQLVVIAPSDSDVMLNPLQNESWQTALNGERLAIGQPNAVPAGIYAQQALENIGVWSSVKRSLAPTNNVRMALTLVERGETPLGIVYQTDAQVSDKVKVIYRFEPSTHQSIRYPMVTLSDTPAVNNFSNYLQTDAAHKILRQYGFEVTSAPSSN
ncbi:molybdate ABC transporter substrate-binding protein [Vibrio scophthalmi]|uniref:molybdate ABC transporter substrate-binding protein n=1 Tax=Vibrio scophthalmi TaxID=45658 RepID=UPI003AAB7288